MKNKTLIILSSVVIIQSIILIFCAKPVAFSNDAVISLIGSIGTIVGGILLFIQIKQQDKSYKLDHLRSRVSNLYNMMNTISYKGDLGAAAIVSYSLSFNEEKDKHPRVVLDHAIQVSEVVRSLLIEIKENSKNLDQNNVKKLILDLLVFYYFNLYFSLSFERSGTLKDSGLIHQLEMDKYVRFKRRTNDLKVLSYKILSYAKIIDTHQESEGNSIQIEDDKLLRILNYFTKR
jgi:hypothetical protein